MTPLTAGGHRNFPHSWIDTSNPPVQIRVRAELISQDNSSSTALDGSLLVGRSGDSRQVAPHRTATSGCCIAQGGALTQRNIQCNPRVITVVSWVPLLRPCRWVRSRLPRWTAANSYFAAGVEFVQEFRPRAAKSGLDNIDFFFN